jgi:hypothetical protein
LADALDGVHRQRPELSVLDERQRRDEGRKEIIDSTGQGLRNCVDRPFEGHMHNTKTCRSIEFYGAHERGAAGTH